MSALAQGSTAADLFTFRGWQCSPAWPYAPGLAFICQVRGQRELSSRWVSCLPSCGHGHGRARWSRSPVPGWVDSVLAAAAQRWRGPFVALGGGPPSGQVPRNPPPELCAAGEACWTPTALAVLGLLLTGVCLAVRVCGARFLVRRGYCRGLCSRRRPRAGSERAEPQGGPDWSEVRLLPAGGPNLRQQPG